MLSECPNCGHELDNPEEIWECWECNNKVCEYCSDQNIAASGDYCEECGEIEYAKQMIEDAEEILGDVSCETVVDTPRIYPYFTSWEEDGQPLFMISLHAAENFEVSLLRMTPEEVERFIKDITEQYELFMKHYSNSHAEEALGE